MGGKREVTHVQGKGALGGKKTGRGEKKEETLPTLPEYVVERHLWPHPKQRSPRHHVRTRGTIAKVSQKRRGIG